MNQMLKMTAFLRLYPIMMDWWVRSRTKVTQELIEQGLKLKVIGRAGVGLDNIDVDYANEKGIIVVNTPDAPSASVAELVIGLTISVVHHIP